MKKHLLSIVTLLVFSMLFAASQTAKQASSKVVREAAKFDFAPPSREKANSTGITIALIRPHFVKDNPEYLVPPFNEMASSMSNDFEELLSAKGFNIRGPFGSRDEMVYNDKKNSNIAFEINIDLIPQVRRKNSTVTNYAALVDKTAHDYSKMSGEITLAGNLVMTVTAPQYGEKIWKKNIALQSTTFNYQGSMVWVTEPSLADELQQDNAVYNTISREIENIYNQALQLAWQQIDSEEMKGVADEAKKADNKKVY